MPPRRRLRRRRRCEVMSEQTNRLAVSATEATALRLEWFFRPQEVSDQGIDAHIEKFEWVAGKDGKSYEVGTGRLIAIQIKGGPSYFSKPSPNGWWFSFDKKKHKLWLGHALPVIVVLVDLEQDELYWQRVTVRTAIKAGAGYKLEIPRTQRVREADSEWVDLASGLERHAEARYEYSLQSLPPDVQHKFENRQIKERADTALLAMHLSEGRLNPRGTVAALLATSPPWLSRNADWAWAAVGAYASDHDVHDLAAEAFERSSHAAVGPLRTQSLVSAALHVREADPGRCDALLGRAETLADDEVVLAVARTVTSVPVGDGSPWSLDPLLVSGDERIAHSAVAQRVLALAARRLGDHDTSIEHGRAALAVDPDSSESMSQLATALLARHAAGGQTEDALEAISLLRSLIAQRRNWSGPVSADEVRLASVCMLLGDLDGAVATCLPPPFGSADPSSLNPDCLRIGVRAAHWSGRGDIVEHAVALMGNDVLDQLALVSVGVVQLSTDEAIALRRTALDRAIADEAFEEVARLGVTLCSEGVDVRQELQPFAARSILPSGMLELCSTLLIASDDLDSALPQLRELAKSDAVAGEFLMGLLQEADRHSEAADAAGMLYEITGSEVYLLQRANCLIDADAREAAGEAARRAVTVTSIRPVERGRLLTFLGAEAADAQDWPLAEMYLTQVLELFSEPRDGDIWRVVTCQLAQGRLKKAAKLITKYRPAVRDEADAKLWLRAHATLRWTERMAMDAFALAERFQDDPELSTALLSHIVFVTHGVKNDESPQGDPDIDPTVQVGADDADLEELDDADLERRRALAQESVPGELHRRAFQMMDELVHRHGDRTGIRVLRGTSENLAEELIAELKRQAESQQALHQLVEQVRESKVPLGFAAGVFRRGYTSTVVQRALGYLVASSAVDIEHDDEVECARAALGQSVVLDVSAVVTLTGVDEPAELAGRFAAQYVPAAAMVDLQRASFDIRSLAGSPGSMAWDPEREAVAVSALDEAEFQRLMDRIDRIDAYTDRLSVRTPSQIRLTDELGKDPHHHVWTETLELAAELQVALWCDDLGLRRMARTHGIPTFGTPGLTDAIRDVALEGSTTAEGDQVVIDRAAALNRSMARDWVVDLPLYADDLLAIAESESWAAGAGALAISRPAWWIANHDGVATVQTLYGHVRNAAPDQLPAWQYAAMRGIARALNAEVGSGVLALLALRGFSDDPTAQERADGLERAIKVASDLGYPDPTAGLHAAAKTLASAGECDDPEAVVASVLALLDDLADGD